MLRRHPTQIPILALLALFALGLAACGGSDSADGEKPGAAQADFPPLTKAPDDSERGGRLTVLATGDVDSLDPGVINTQMGFMVGTATQRSLLGWPTDADEPQPDLAAAEPEVSDDGRTVTFEIREGIEFGPPVNREVVAADFKYAIERGMLPGVANPYMGTYMSALNGYSEAEQAVGDDPTTAPDIAGITTPDDHTLVLEFTEGIGKVAVQALALPLGAPVPEDYAAEFDAESPSTYGDHLVATGPYMIPADASGELTGYTPGESIELVRNPAWQADTDFRPAYLDEIEVQEGFSNTGSASDRILSGESMVNGDFSPDPPVLKRAAENFPDQLALIAQRGNRYVTLNTQLAPLDNINVRKAILAATDREAMRLTRGGTIAGEIANHFIPPIMPGFEQAGGYEGTGVDFLENPEGDPELAADYMRKAGFESGRYEGDETLLMIVENSTVEQRTAQVVREAVEGLGFKVNFRPVSQEAMYTRFCTVPKAEIAICPNIAWGADFNDTQTILMPTFSGEAIQPKNNTNISELDVPEINQAMNDAAQLTDPDEQAEAWGEIDRQVTAQAPAIPWLWDFSAIISSPDVVNVVNSFHGSTDLSATSLKGT